MNMPELRCFLCLDDGRVLKLQPGDPQLQTVRSETARYIAVDVVPPRLQYQWISLFVSTVEDETLRARLEACINGKGAFRRFKDVLLTLPETRQSWFDYRDAQMRQYVVDWVRDHRIHPLNAAPWDEGPKSASEEAVASVDEIRDVLLQWSQQNDPATVFKPEALSTLATQLSHLFTHEEDPESS